MFNNFTGFKSSCVTVLRILSENDGFDVEDKYVWLCVPLYQALIYSMALEEEFWNLMKENGDTNEFDWCIAKSKLPKDIPGGSTLAWLKRNSLENDASRIKWRESVKSGLLKDECFFENDDYWANAVQLVKVIRDNVVHANCDEIEKIQEFLFTTSENDRNIHIMSAFHTVTSLIGEICDVNYEINSSTVNYSSRKFSKDFVRKFNFWLKGAAVWG